MAETLNIALGNLKQCFDTEKVKTDHPNFGRLQYFLYSWDKEFLRNECKQKENLSENKIQNSA